MSYLDKIEKEKGLIIPDLLRRFLRKCRWSMPPDLVGTDLLRKEDLNDGARELFEEIGIENFLHEKDLVFMMHQGYIFWYLRADGNPDPVVFEFSESEMKQREHSLLSAFIKPYM
jgi:hypothetical protein